MFGSGNGSGECEVGECGYLVEGSCREQERPASLAGGPLVTDQDGCFATNHLRTTIPYEQFLQVMQHKYIGRVVVY